MMNVNNLFDLSVEEKAVLAQFEKEIDKVIHAPDPVISESVISKIEATLTNIIEEIINRGRQADKSNA